MPEQTPTVGMERKLAAIMFTDIVGFSRQMGADESRTLRLLALHNQLIQQAATAHQGTVIKTIGDAFLVEFPSVVRAVQCAQKIVTTLKLQLTLQEKGWIMRKRTANLEAYDAVLRGIEYFWRSTKDPFAQARQMYEHALALDPQYAEAYAWLGITYYREWIWRWSVDPQTLERALELAQQALALNDSLPFAHSVLSVVHTYKQQYDPAIAEGERAIVLDPHLALSHALLAETWSRMDRKEEALRGIEQALQGTPRIVDEDFSSIGVAYALIGRLEKAVVPLKQYLLHYANHLGVHLTLAAVYSELGREAEARAEAAEVLRLNPKFSLEVHKQRMPIKDPAVLERHLAALRKAGLK